MRHLFILPIAVLPLLTGCVSQPPPASRVVPPVPVEPLVVAPVETFKHVETPYDVRSYRDPSNPSVRHAAHTVYRRTRVPLNAPDRLETVSRETFAPASLAPLPASAELNAELASQRQITAELRGMQAALADAGEQMQAQYAALVRHSADTLKLRDQLEAERSRLRAAEPASPAVTVPSVPAPPAQAVSTTEAKW